MIEGVVYFHGSLTAWQEHPHEREWVHRFSVPWLWLARRIARQSLGNTGRCGYMLWRRGGELIEHVRAQDTQQL